MCLNHVNQSYCNIQKRKAAKRQLDSELDFTIDICVGLRANIDITAEWNNCAWSRDIECIKILRLLRPQHQSTMSDIRR